MNTIWKSWRILVYLLKKKGPHGIHSPYVYKLVSEDFRRQVNDKVIQNLSGFLNGIKLSSIKKIGLLIDDNNDLQLLKTEHFLKVSDDLIVFYSPQHFQNFQSNTNELNEECRCVILGILKKKMNFYKWNELKDNPLFHCTLDCGEFGVLVKRTHQQKEHFTI